MGGTPVAAGGNTEITEFHGDTEVVLEVRLRTTLHQSLLVIYPVFLTTRIGFGVESRSRLGYDTEQQVTGNHLLRA